MKQYEFTPRPEWSDEKNRVANHYSKNPLQSLWLQHERKWESDKDIALVIAKSNGYGLRSFNRQWYMDREVAIEAVGSNPSSFEMCPDGLKSDKSFALDCARRLYEVQGKGSLAEYSFYLHRGIFSKCSGDIQEICQGQDPIQSLERAIAYESMQSTLAKKQEPREQKRGLKI